MEFRLLSSQPAGGARGAEEMRMNRDVLSPWCAKILVFILYLCCRGLESAVAILPCFQDLGLTGLFVHLRHQPAVRVVDSLCAAGTGTHTVNILT